MRIMQVAKRGRAKKTTPGFNCFAASLFLWKVRHTGSGACCKADPFAFVEWRNLGKLVLQKSEELRWMGCICIIHQYQSLKNRG